MIAARHIGMLVVAVLCSGQLLAQTDANKTPPAEVVPANPWAFNLSVSGYDVPHGESYASPTFTADHDTLRMEARYNYEGLRTGSLWVGYNLSARKKLVIEATRMIGGGIWKCEWNSSRAGIHSYLQEARAILSIRRRN